MTTTILLIEDDPLVRKNLQDILELESFQILEASNGKEGLLMAQTHLPDLILCDVMMPEMDGYQVLQHLRQNPTTKNIPLIFLTAKSELESLRTGMDLGADDYLIKPYSIKALLLSIRLRLDKKASLQEEAQQELSDFRYRLTRSLPKRLNNLISPLHSAANTLKQLSDNLTVQEIEEIAEKIENNSVEIHRLFINLSLYSQLEMIVSNPKMREAYQSKRSQCFPSAVISKVVQLKAQQYQRLRDLKLTLQDTKVALSETNFKKIIEELIDNAFRYSLPGSTVEIVSQIDGSRYRLFIIDAGQGMESELYENLMGNPKSSLSDPKGNLEGFGLVIAKYLVELNGGKLHIESIPHKQTIVHLTFSLAS